MSSYFVMRAVRALWEQRNLFLFIVLPTIAAVEGASRAANLSGLLAPLEGQAVRLICLMCVAIPLAILHHRRFLLSRSSAAAMSLFEGRTLVRYFGHSIPVVIVATVGTLLYLLVMSRLFFSTAPTVSFEYGDVSFWRTYIGAIVLRDGSTVTFLTLATALGLSLPAVALGEDRPDLSAIWRTFRRSVLPLFGVLAPVSMLVAVFEASIFQASFATLTRWITTLTVFTEIIRDALYLSLSAFLLSALYEDHLAKKNPAEAGVFE